MRKYLFILILVLSGFVLKGDVLALDCPQSLGCNYTSSQVFCTNGSCGPGWCEGVEYSTGCTSCNPPTGCIATFINCYSCTPPCTPVCNAPYCGQANGCGGNCSSGDVGNWTQTGYFCESGCGTKTCYNTYEDPCGNWYWQPVGSVCNECGPYGSQSCGNWTQTYDCSGPVSGCTECGPNISAWSAWSACSPSTFQRTRTRTCSENCGTNDCAGVSLSESETCYGSVSGTFFDASLVSNCSTMASQPKIGGVGVDLTAQVSHSTVYSTTTNGDGDYSRGSLLVPDTYNLTYSVNGGEWISDPPKLLCDGSLTGISLTTQAQAVTRRVGLWRVYGGWFQSQGGDMAAKNGISVQIPATCTLAENQATCGSFDSGGTIYTPLVRDSVPVAGTGDPGIAFSTTIDTGDATNAVVSSSGKEALSVYQGRIFNYGYYFAQTGRLERQIWNGIDRPITNPTGLIYKSSGNIIIDSDWNLGVSGDERIFIMHDGDITITSNMNVAPGSYLGIVASGTITFASNVTQVEGVYIADTINIASTGDVLSEQQFVGEGTFVGWSGVQLNRDRGTGNNAAPAELFIFRPDFVINAFDGVRIPEIRWQEIPG